MKRPDDHPSTKGAATARRSAVAAALALALIAPWSCGRDSAAKAAERERVAEAKAEVAALEADLKSARGDEARVGCLRGILAVEVMRTGELESALKRYEKEEALLGKDMMSRIYAAVAQSMMAGKARKIEDKLAWLMKGMRGFDDLRAEYPEDENVMLYQASTYANFPIEVGSRDEVLDLLASMRVRYADGRWKLSDGVAGQIAYIYGTIGSIYGDAESAGLIRASREAFAAAVPAFASAAAGMSAR